MTAFQKAMDVAMQLLQSAVIDAKKARLSDTGEAIVKDAVTAQLNTCAPAANWRCGYCDCLTSRQPANTDRGLDRRLEKKMREACFSASLC